jgi:hypothetical protein
MSDILFCSPFFLANKKDKASGGTDFFENAGTNLLQKI